jgi:pSer/pThr/pTyr-binding forkhead associated (FHA) protein
MLTVKNGGLGGQRFVFEDHHKCVIGRGEDCTVHLPNDTEHRTVSRHHCLLDIELPKVRVRDSGSYNGTRLNGMQIGRPRTWNIPKKLAALPYTEYDLKNGDELEVGETVFQVTIAMPEDVRNENQTKGVCS